ncbi:MBL fold metallo-hydrolase [Parasphingopyxis marina]|uniref:MBL fold metallo-hydrolase n=1 Tax=Parasphingopyxis marina TaxID=2761622 RepID=A0A842HXK5_9SPHN|nr:MBL fold metallo-hydrolase [Parasphingopyxis marina]MBC2777826.1 MBL fold metallo-hydrolase [Parasphingopyxis marina]
MKLRILGCGTSSGVPRIGNDWGACDPQNPKNRRMRSSILVSTADTHILVDTGPDLRQQLLDADSKRIDHVIWTHEHADHCHGIDELRQLYFALGGPVPCHARPGALREITQRFDFAFKGTGPYPSYAQPFPLSDNCTLGGITVTAADMPHGSITSAALRFEYGGASVAYTTDFTGLTAKAMECVSDVDIWVVDALRRREHPTHPHLAQVLGWIEKARPKRAILTHMDHSMDYDMLSGELPDGVEPGYDGLEVEIG